MVTTESEECSAIAFYGVSSNAEAFSEFYNILVEYFTALGHPPDKLGVTRSSVGGKLIDFELGRSRLIKAGFEGVRSISLISSPPDAKIFGIDYLLSASCVALSTPKVVIAGRSSIINLTPDSLLLLVRLLAPVLKPKYGIGYKRSLRLGPTSYASGVLQGIGPNGLAIPSQLTPVEKIEIENMSRWGIQGMNGRVWEKGLIRDVYLWNFLSQPHLSRSVLGTPLEKWIQKDAHRGKLNMLTDGAYFWEVSENNIGEIRRELSLAGIIFDWKKHL